METLHITRLYHAPLLEFRHSGKIELGAPAAGKTKSLMVRSAIGKI
jgi:hypothetical protein